MHPILEMIILLLCCLRLQAKPGKLVNNWPKPFFAAARFCIEPTSQHHPHLVIVGGPWRSHLIWQSLRCCILWTLLECTIAVLFTSQDPSSGIHIVTLLLYKCKEALFTVQCNVRLEYALFSETSFVCWHCSPVHFSVHHFNLIPRSSTPSCPLFN